MHLFTRKQVLLVGFCLLGFQTSTMRYEASASERQVVASQVVAQQIDDDRAAALRQEIDELKAEGSRESLLRAVDIYSELLDVYHNSEEHSVTRAFLLTEFGLVLLNLGERDSAIARYEQALSIFREADVRQGEAFVLGFMGVAYAAKGEKNKALDYYEQSLSISRELPDMESATATALNNIGSIYESMGEKDKALDYYEQALSVHQGVENRKGEATTLNNIAGVYKSLGERAKALAYYEQVLLIFREIQAKDDEALALNNIGVVYDSTGEKNKALEYYEQALSIFEETGNGEGEASTLGNIGSVYNSIGENDRALQYYEKALSVFVEIQNREKEATTLNNIGSLYDSIGEIGKALAYFEQALRIYREIQNKDGEATTLSNMGSVYKSTGEDDRALKHYEQALSISREIQGREEEVTALNNIGSLYSSIGEMDKALTYYNQALPIRREIQDREGEATTLSNIADVYNLIDEKGKALEYYEQALPIRREVQDTKGEAGTLNNIGFLYYWAGEKHKALEHYERSLTLSREIRDRESEATTLSNIALVERDFGDLNQALESISLAINIIEGIRTGISSDDSRTSYFSTVQDHYQVKTDILMQLGRAEEAFETSESSRARVLAELLDEANVDIREGVPTELLTEEDKIRQELLIVDQKYAALRSRNHENEEATSLERESDDLLQKLDRTISRIRQISPAYAETIRPQPLSLQQIQQQVLDADTVLLQYSLGAEQSYLWIVGADEFQSYTLPGEGELEAAARAFQSATSTDTSTPITVRKGKELVSLILPELPDWLANKRLLISGDGILSEIAFNALPSPRYENYTPLLIDHEILTQSSISSVNILRQQLASRSDLPLSVALLADPVYRAQDERITGQRIEPEFPVNASRNLRDLNLQAIKRLKYTRTEAEAILETARNLPTTNAYDFDANYDWITSPTLGDYSVVHLATHGFVNSVNPQLSGIVLNLVEPDGTPTDKGFLRLHDIFNLELNAELVVLSACQTGLGENISGEGIVGLSRGFMYAGAERVMVSLWNVEDESTATLMSAFYRYLIEDEMTPAAALRAAQKERWEAGDKPQQWAAFTLQGEWQ